MKKLEYKIEKIFVEEDYLDEKFPKGDKRRGEVLALIRILNAKIQKILKEKDAEPRPCGRCTGKDTMLVCCECLRELKEESVKKANEESANELLTSYSEGYENAEKEKNAEIEKAIDELYERYNRETYYRNHEKQFSILKDLKELKQKFGVGK